MPFHCVKCDLARTDSTTPCGCGCATWSSLPGVEVTRLVEAHLPMVGWVVKRWIIPVLVPSTLRRIGIEEIMATGQERLLSLARRYDPERGAKFSTYAVLGLQRALWSFVNREIRRHEREGFYPQYSDDRDPFDPIDKRPDLLIEVDTRDEASAILPGLFAVLNPRERIAVEMVKAAGLRQREAANVLGVTRERVRQLAKVGIAKMREAAESEPVP